MAKAVADPAEIRRFAHDLKRFNTEIQGQMQTMNARMGTLGQTWRDQEQVKFQEEFDATMKTLLRFMKASMNSLKCSRIRVTSSGSRNGAKYCSPR